MSYKRELEKALKLHLAPLGFKYKAKDYRYYRNYSDDIVQGIGWADERYEEPGWHFLKTFVGVGSVSLEKILSEVTDGLAGGRIETPSGPPYFCMHGKVVNFSKPNEDYIHCIFKPERSMEDNIAEFDKMYENKVAKLFDMYNTQKAIYLCPITDEYFNEMNAPCNWYYVPLAYYFNGEFDKAFEFIEERVRIVYELIERFGFSESDATTLELYDNYKRNLKKWIEERRQFKVDDEYLPVF